MKLDTIHFEENFCQWNNLFDEEELNKIQSICDGYETISGTVGTNSEEDLDYRKSKISWIHKNQDNYWIFNKFDAAVAKLNAKFFGFDINSLEVLQFTVYEGQGFYDWHWDCINGNSLNDLNFLRQRKVSAVLQLSDEDDYVGGQLQIAPGGNIITIQKQKGLLTVFPSFVNHKVTEVEEGTRKTLVAWFTGPDWR